MRMRGELTLVSHFLTQVNLGHKVPLVFLHGGWNRLFLKSKQCCAELFGGGCEGYGIIRF